MRSNKISEALNNLHSRFALCQLASKGVRRFHNPGTRIQDTTNDVLDRIVATGREDQVQSEEMDESKRHEVKH